MTFSSLLRHSPRSLVWLVAGLSLSVGAALWQADYNAELAQRRFDSLSRRAADQVSARMHLFEYGLRAARGAVLAAGGENGITRLGFAQFCASRDLQKEFPGSNGFGYVRRVPAAEEAAFVGAARLDGKPDFKVHQIGPNDGERYIIQYFEPSDPTTPAIGLDIASEPLRRAAAQQAMVTGEPVMTAPIDLLVTQQGDRRSFLLLLPIYKAETQLERLQLRSAQSAAARGTPEDAFGWVYTPLLADRVLSGLDFQDGQFAMALADVTDGGRPQPFFVSGGQGAAADASLQRVLPLALFGRQWQVEVTALPLFWKQLNLRSPWWIFFGGATLSVLSALLSLAGQSAAQRQRQASEQRSRLAAIVTSSNDAIIACGLDGRITDWNDGASKIFGYSAEQALGQTTRRLLLPPDFAHEEDTLLQHIAQGRSVAAFETFRRHREGSPVAVSVAAAPIRSAGGQVIGAAQTVRDITHEQASKARILELNATLEQQVSERTAQLAALSRRERAILADAASAIIATDVDGVVTVFNPAAEALLGYSAAEVVERVEMTRFHDAAELQARSAALSAELGRPLQRCEVFTPSAGADLGRPREWTYVRKDGRRVAVHLNVSSLRDADNQVVGFIAIGSDLTERKHAEDQLERLNLTLNKRSAQAESASRAKSEFLANMSHEIRSPLNAVIGLVQLLRRTTLDATQSSFLLKINAASHALLGVINNVLDISKIEAGEMTLEEGEFELQALLDGVIGIMSVSAADKGVAISLEAASSLPPHLRGDVTRIRQILVNLLSNAIKFTAQGSVRLSVRAEEGQPAQAPGLRLRFAVIDTGIGIDAEVQRRLFTPFTQADASTTRRFGGTGLGLSIVKQLTELMGGECGVFSAPGRGSEFWVSLPLAVERGPVADGLPAAPGEARLVGLRLLVVDDTAVNLLICQHILEREGARVGVARDGREAVERLRAGPADFDLVLMDVHMPVLDGMGATRLIRDELGLAALPVIALTASALVAERQGAFEAGMNDFIGKPFDAERLIRAVLRGVERARAGAVAARPPASIAGAGGG
ncbi:MAG TPA: CHASE domain-containing protein [Variovorax sp.]